MIVAEIWRYPVKSVGGERVQSVTVNDVGLEYDRGWAIFRTGTNDALTARRSPELLFASATVVDDDVLITLPDGTQTRDNETLSTWLGIDVELRRAGSIGADYENPMDAENETDWVTWTGPAGSFHDSARSRLSLVSTDSLRDWDIRRFRTNLVVDGAGEDEFVGQVLTIGTGVFDVTKQIDRCVMITRPQPGLARDLGILKTINSERATFLSVGMNARGEGLVSVGDAVSREASRS